MIILAEAVNQSQSWGLALVQLLVSGFGGIAGAYAAFVFASKQQKKASDKQDLLRIQALYVSSIDMFNTLGQLYEEVKVYDSMEDSEKVSQLAEIQLPPFEAVLIDPLAVQVLIDRGKPNLALLARLSGRRFQMVLDLANQQNTRLTVMREGAEIESHSNVERAVGMNAKVEDVYSLLGVVDGLSQTTPKAMDDLKRFIGTLEATMQELFPSVDNLHFFETKTENRVGGRF